LGIDDSFDVDCIDGGIRHSADTICNASGIKLLDIYVNKLTLE